MSNVGRKENSLVYHLKKIFSSIESMSRSFGAVIQPLLLVCINLSITEDYDRHSATITLVLPIGDEFTFREKSNHICFVVGDHFSLRGCTLMTSQCSRGREEHEETWRWYFYPV